MGSFYSTCSISDLVITDGDPTYMQLIIPTWVTNPFSIDGEQVGCGEKGLRVSNEGSMGEWVPFGFPIEGRYADYGNIDQITRDRNVEMLEEFFNISIDDILSCATDDRWYRHSYKPGVEEGEKEEYKGQHKSWTVGDNKMKNIDILKDMTVTYFRKENYDFLSEKTIGTDNYWEKEKEKRLKKLLKSLEDLEKARPENEEKEPFTEKEITDKLLERYEIIRGKKTTDEEFEKLIVEMENFKDRQWWREFERVFYIPSITKRNMFQILPIGPKDVECVQKQFRFLTNLSELRKVLRPSYYGSQDNNYDGYVEFYKMSVELVNSKKLELKKDDVLFNVGWALKESLKDVNKELSDKIKRDIKEGLGEYGYDIKL